MGVRIFIRHGESEYNAGLSRDYDSPLTPSGVRQAREAAKYVARNYSAVKFTGLVSPYLRCLNTADIVREGTGIPFAVDPSCREWPLEVPAERRKVAVRRKDFPQFSWPDGDMDWSAVPHEDYMKSLQKFVEGLPADALVVSHQTTVEQLLFLAANPGKLPSRHSYYIYNASVSVLKDGEPVVLGRRCEGFC